MHPDDRRKVYVVISLLVPLCSWLVAVKMTKDLERPHLKALFRVARETPHQPILLAALGAGVVLAALAIFAVHKLSTNEFAGASFRLFLRGTKVVTASALRRRTSESEEQITVADVPMPVNLECLHLLAQGSTGVGKSVLIREIVFGALCRGDRVIVADPNGDMLSKFYRPGDAILNPYDSRGAGWSFFNEVRHDYDFKRLALSIVPHCLSVEEEEWRQYARLLLTETARKLVLVGQPSIDALFKHCTIDGPDELKKFLSGTAAESLFVGAEKALASARFVLSSKLPEHLSMPPGDFSLRSWLEQPKGNLFITWREDMVESLRPLISAWVDVLCTSVLSLEESRDRRLWMILDELPSLDNLASLEDAATKGRKHGLRIVAGIQSTAQLDKVYGREQAQTLRSCFRNLIVFGGAKTDPRTCDDMSQGLGEHEVERDNRSRSHSPRGNTSNEQEQVRKERVVLPSEITALPDLQGFLALAGEYPIARVRLTYRQFKRLVPPFQERGMFRPTHEPHHA